MRRSTLFPQLIAPSGPAQQTFAPLGRAEVVDRTPNGLRFRSGPHQIDVRALANDLFRVGLFADGRPVEYSSEAVARTEWPTVDVRLSADGTRIETAAAIAHVGLDPLRIGFADPGGRQFAVDDADFGMGLVPLAPAATQLVDPLGSPSIVYK